MKYLIRSIKYFFYFSIICALLVSILVLIGAAEADVDALFKDGYLSILEIALFFAVVAGVYPMLGFIKKRTDITSPWADIRDKTLEYMSEKRYEIEEESDTRVTFRIRGFLSKTIKMYEDRITLVWDGGEWTIEGLRKDVTRISSGLEHRLTTTC